jgi:DNA-binding NarL/FixJ family response regulator
VDQLSILIVDDHLLIRQGLKQLLSQEFRDVVLGEAATAEEALARIRSRSWNLVILDVSLPDGDGFSVLREIHAANPQSVVLMLSMHTDSQYASRALKLGAAGYVSKSSSRSDLVKAVKNALDKKHVSSIARAADKRPAAPHERLSAQELKVLLALAAGSRPGEIAVQLNLSGKTVSTYKRRILSKLGLQSLADLVRYAVARKLA